MEIKEVTNSIKKNWMPIALGVGLLIIVMSLLSSDSGSGESSELVVSRGYTAYPDAVTNANTIIGEVNDNTNANFDYLQDILDAMQGYQEEGKADILDKIDQNTDKIVGVIDTSTDSITNKIDTATNKVIQNSAKPVVTKPSSKVRYFRKTSIKNGSIVDTLKKIGANSSYSYRAKIAKANGITGYRGSASQNIKMLNLLKSGKLKKPA